MSTFRILDFNHVFDPSVDLTLSNEDPNFPASNLRSFLRSDVARTSAGTDESLVIDLKTTEEIDSVALVWDARLGIQFSDNAVLKIQASATDSWVSPPVDITLTIDEDHLVATHFFAAPESYRYWRLKMDDATNTTGYFEIPKIVLSEATQLGQNPEIGFSYDIEDQSKNTENSYGHRFSDIYPNRREYEFDYKNMLYADLETLADIFDRTGETAPVCIAVDVDETLFDKDRFFLYGFFDGDLKTKQVFTNVFDAPLKLVEAM